MYKKIYEIAEVIPGYSFRGAIHFDPEGQNFVIQAKDIIQGKYISETNSLTKIEHNIPDYTGFLRKGDVLIVARGMKTGTFRSTVFESFAENVVVSSSVHVIRIKDESVLPEFLSLYLNSKEGQDLLSEKVSGSYIGALPRRGVEEIKIPLLPLERQKTFIELDQNIRDQQRITNRQNEIRQNIINASFRNLITS